LVPLVDSLEALDEESSGEAEFERGGLHLLSSFADEPQLAYARRLLDAAGVPSVIQGGHARNVEGCGPYRLYVAEADLEQAQAVLASYDSPSLVTGEIEGNLDRLQSSLRRIEREQKHLAPQLQTVVKSIERLRVDLQALNRMLDEEG
jgi:hypothetical protein